MSSIDDPLRIAGTRPALRDRTRAGLARPGRFRGRPALLGPLLMRGVLWLMEMQRRAEMRQEIREMDPRILRDIGATRAELLEAVDGEPVELRFWRLRGWGM